MTPISATKASSPASTAPPIDKQDFDDVRRMLQGQFVRGNPAVPRGRSYPVGAQANGLPQGRFGPSSFGAPPALAAARRRQHPPKPDHPNRVQIAGNRFLQDFKRASLSRMLRHPLSAAAGFAVKFISRLMRPSKA